MPPLLDAVVHSSAVSILKTNLPVHSCPWLGTLGSRPILRRHGDIGASDFFGRTGSEFIFLKQNSPPLVKMKLEHITTVLPTGHRRENLPFGGLDTNVVTHCSAVLHPPQILSTVAMFGWSFRRSRICVFLGDLGVMGALLVLREPSVSQQEVSMICRSELSRPDSGREYASHAGTAKGLDRLGTRCRLLPPSLPPPVSPHGCPAC